MRLRGVATIISPEVSVPTTAATCSCPIVAVAPIKASVVLP